MTEPVVPSQFLLPDPLIGDGFRLESLGPEHNDRDHAAWMSSIEHIHATPGFARPDRKWPVEMSLEQNLRDVEMHAADFIDRTGFTYSVLDGNDVIGCVYIYPSRRAEFDAEVRSWVTESRADLDVVLWESVSAWLEQSWPFANPCYEPRR